jgi:hypothetical protein
VDQFFSPASFGTVSACVLAVIVIANSTRHALGWGPRWAILLLSIAVAIVAFSIAWSDPKSSVHDLVPVVIALIVVANGCLIYTSSFGIQNTVISVPDPPTPAGAAAQAPEAPAHESAVRWRTRW